MSPAASLTCEFTIECGFNIGVSFDTGNASYGGLVTIVTGAPQADPVTTGLWDDDGNVLFTIYLEGDPSTSCTVNSGSVPGSWLPDVEATESGLACAVSAPRQTGESTYAYTLTVSRAVPPDTDAATAS